jgi:hypothetical protein
LMERPGWYRGARAATRSYRATTGRFRCCVATGVPLRRRISQGRRRWRRATVSARSPAAAAMAEPSSANAPRPGNGSSGRGSSARCLPGARCRRRASAAQMNAGCSPANRVRTGSPSPRRNRPRAGHIGVAFVHRCAILLPLIALLGLVRVAAGSRAPASPPCGDRRHNWCEGNDSRN